MKTIKSDIWLIPLTVITVLGTSMFFIYLLEMVGNGFSFTKLSWAIVVLMISLHPLHVILVTVFNKTCNEYNWVNFLHYLTKNYSIPHLLSIAIPTALLILLTVSYPLEETFPGKSVWSYIVYYGVLIAVGLVCIGKGVYYVRNTESRTST